MKKAGALVLLVSLPILFPIISFSQNIAGNTKEAAIVAEKNSFSGKVTDEKTKEPLVGASLFFTDLKMGAVTNEQGLFVMNNVPLGKHLLEISFIGYATRTEYILMTSDLQKNFSLSASVLENNEVIVTGVSAATQARRSPTPVAIIKKQDLIKVTATNLIDLLSHKPGISQISTGPAISKPVIRGLGYNRVVVLNDGIRQEGQQWGDEHGIEIDEYSVQKVELLKGPASLMYGSDAMAGVINIFTNVPVAQGTWKASVTSNYQTNNRLRGTGINIGGYGVKGFNWNAYGTLKAAADYTNKYDGRVYNSKFKEADFGGYMGWNGSWGYSHLVFSQYGMKTGIVEGDRDADGKFIKPLPGGGEAVATESDFNAITPQIPWQHILHRKIVSDNSFRMGDGRLNVVLGFQNNQRTEYGNIDDPKEKELFFDLGTATYNITYHFKEKNHWNSSVGLGGMSQMNKNKGAEVLIPEYQLFDIGGFYFLQRSFDKITVSGGVRFDNRSIDSKELMDGADIKFAGFKKQFSNFSGSAGMSYMASKQVILKLNVARGYRAPSIAELASNGTHEGTNRYEYGDQKLKSETSLQLDGGLEWTTDHLSFSASLFYNNISNFIFYNKLASVSGGDSLVDVAGDLITAFKFSQRNAVLSGAEFTLDIHPHPLDWLHFENTFSFVNGRFAKELEGSKNIPFVPAARLLSDVRGDFLSKGKRFRNLFVKLEVEQTFAQQHPFTGYNTETATGSYTLIHAGTGVDIVSGNKTLLSIYFTGTNLADVAYQNHLNRLKYTAVNNATGRMGVFNMGRNFSFKINIPLSGKLGKAS